MPQLDKISQAQRERLFHIDFRLYFLGLVNRTDIVARFGPGLPRINDGALLFLLHMISKMQRPPEHYTLPAPGGIQGGEGSRIAIIFNGSPLFTGDAGGRRRLKKIGAPSQSR